MIHKQELQPYRAMLLAVMAKVKTMRDQGKSLQEVLAANLTTQVRAIAEVATAVTKGDLTRSIQVEARGEVAELKDNINTMIDNLRLTTDRNTEQDWLKTNLARFTNMLQGQRDLGIVGRGQQDAQAVSALILAYAVLPCGLKLLAWLRLYRSSLTTV